MAKTAKLSEPTTTHDRTTFSPNARPVGTAGITFGRITPTTGRFTRLPA
ncbi:hypothetical protein BH11PLA2_BH11PLA2_52370 [soil metagenome]